MPLLAWFTQSHVLEGQGMTNPQTTAASPLPQHRPKEKQQQKDLFLQSFAP